MSRRFVNAKSRTDNLRLVAYYSSGKAVGTAWLGLIGGGYLVGPLDQDSKVSGDHCIYIYPDLKTAICGKFDGSNLVSGFPTTIIGTRVENEIVVPVVAMTPPRDEAATSPAAMMEMVRDTSTSQRISR